MSCGLFHTFECHIPHSHSQNGSTKGRDYTQRIKCSTQGHEQQKIKEDERWKTDSSNKKTKQQYK